MPGIAAWCPRADVVTRHEVVLPVPPERALEIALATPAAPDWLVRTLFLLRGLPAGNAGTLGTLFPELERTATEAVFGFAGRPWRPGVGMRPLGGGEPGTVRIVAGFRAEPLPAESSLLVTETRVAAVDEPARRAFLRYWRLVGPFSGLVRRRWLAAVRRQSTFGSGMSEG